MPAKGEDSTLRSKLKTVFLATTVTLITISLIIFPKESLDASTRGLELWWGIVFPTLLPFFIITELLIGFGVVKFIGVLLEPFMRPIFKVPGIGGFVWAMAMASGNPAGAKLTARMREEGNVSRIEAERLISFTSGSNPLFIVSAVSVGFFHNIELGLILAVAHYGGNFFVGLLMRFYGRRNERLEREERSRLSIKAALIALHKTRLNDKRPIGKLLGDAIINSIQTLLMIGGFIILFSVLNKILYLLNITQFLASIIGVIFTLFSLPIELTVPFISGLFEITLGSQLISEIHQASLLQQAMIVSFILAFGGFSIHAQVASIIAPTDIRFQPFIVARIIHGFIAMFLTYLLWVPLYEDRIKGSFSDSSPVFNLINHQSAMDIILEYGPLFTIISLYLYILIYVKRSIHIWK